MNPRHRPALLAVAYALGTSLLVAGCVVVPARPGQSRASTGSTAGSSALSVPRDARPVVVTRIVDGDTVVVRPRRPGAGGLRRPPARAVTVRLLEVDTPEVVAPGVPVQCFGREATRATARLLPVGSRAYVTRDADLRDDYGRHLRYVWSADGTFVNERLVRTGHARAVLFPPNDRYIARMRGAEHAARSARAGLWGACGGGDRRGRAVIPVLLSR
ncbi:MAG: thermonuclease family protein [Actinomycetes bacterium]